MLHALVRDIFAPPPRFGVLLTTEVMIAEASKYDEHAHGGGAPGGVGGMCGMDM